MGREGGRQTEREGGGREGRIGVGKRERERMCGGGKGQCKSCVHIYVNIKRAKCMSYSVHV